MKYNKNADTFLFLLLFAMGQCENNIEKTLFVSAGVQKGWKTAGSGSTSPQYLFIFNIHIKYYLSYFQRTKKLKRFH